MVSASDVSLQGAPILTILLLVKIYHLVAKSEQAKPEWSKYWIKYRMHWRWLSIPSMVQYYSHSINYIPRFDMSITACNWWSLNACMSIIVSSEFSMMHRYWSCCVCLQSGKVHECHHSFILKIEQQDTW